MDLSDAEVVLRAYEVIEAALDAGDHDSAVPRMRAELEVLDRESLLRVAMAIAGETALVLIPRKDRRRLQIRIQQRRLGVMFLST
ncbi:MAG: hypothetical protein CMH83_19060 [Nocardioides sp.]|nr:hypothetical protein [Nocardioides sp.]